MQDIERIDTFTSELNQMWKEHFPHWHFGRFMSTLMGWIWCVQKEDTLFVKDEKMLPYLYEFCEENSDVK